MASTPTSQITRIVTSSVSNEPAANLSANAGYQTSSYLVQGDPTLTPRLEVEKTMTLHRSHLLGN